MNTPGTSLSGNVHGMPLAALLGPEPAELSKIGTFSPKMLPANTVLVGIRSIDDARALLAAGAGRVVVGTAAFPDPAPWAVLGEQVVVALDVRERQVRTAGWTVRFDPPSAVADAEWLTVTAWQGGGRLVVDRLRARGDGVYATTRPIPRRDDDTHNQHTETTRRIA